MAITVPETLLPDVPWPPRRWEVTLAVPADSESPLLPPVGAGLSPRLQGLVEACVHVEARCGSAALAEAERLLPDLAARAARAEVRPLPALQGTGTPA